MASGSPTSHLLGSLPDRLKRSTGQRCGVRELQFVHRERDDNAFLIGPNHVRDRASFNLRGNDLIGLVDRVGAEVCNRSCNYDFGFVWGRPRSIMADNLGRSDRVLTRAKWPSLV